MWALSLGVYLQPLTKFLVSDRREAANVGEPERQVAPRQGLAVNEELKEGTRQTQQTTWGVQTKQE